MNADKNNKKLDELISKTIGRDRPKFDFDKWKQTHKKEIDIFESQEEPPKTNSSVSEPNIKRLILLSKVGYIAAAFLVVSSLVACFVLSEKVNDLRNKLEQARREVAVAGSDETATINLYLKEHQDVVARHVSMGAGTPQPAQIHVSRHDILYYEFLDDGPEFMRPGIIVRGSASQHQIDSSKAPVISNGHILTLSEVKQAAGFDVVLPSWLDPGYALDQIRRIEGRDALQLLYTDGINSVSLFEQPLDGQRGLSRRDFREYAVYRNKEQAGGTILAWRDDALSYVLIGKVEMSQLMDMAWAITAGK
jgi:hypothetical protein